MTNNVHLFFHIRSLHSMASNQTTMQMIWLICVFMMELKRNRDIAIILRPIAISE